MSKPAMSAIARRIEALEARQQPPSEPPSTEVRIVDRVRMADGLDHVIVKTIHTGPPESRTRRDLEPDEWIDLGPCPVTFPHTDGV